MKINTNIKKGALPLFFVRYRVTCPSITSFLIYMFVRVLYPQGSFIPYTHSRVKKTHEYHFLLCILILLHIGYTRVQIQLNAFHMDTTLYMSNKIKSIKSATILCVCVCKSELNWLVSIDQNLCGIITNNKITPS